METPSRFLSRLFHDPKLLSGPKAICLKDGVDHLGNYVMHVIYSYFPGDGTNLLKVLNNKDVFICDRSQLMRNGHMIGTFAINPKEILA